MFKSLALIGALICLTDLVSAVTIINGRIVSEQNQREIKHIFLDDANLISSTQGYAINHRDLLNRLNVKTISINGDKVELYDSQCQLTSMSRSQLSMMNEKDEVINNAIRSMQAVENGANLMDGQAMRSGVTHYSLNGNSISSSGNGNMKSSNFNSNGISVVKFDDNNLSIAKPAGGLPNNINRLFMNNEVVTFVYHDGQVLMKPAACMSQQEQQLAQQLRLEVQEAKRRFDMQMQQFQQNMQMGMQNMRRNMQQNMLNMRQNMQNIFAPGFPFHNQPMMMSQMGGQNGMRQNPAYGFSQAGSRNYGNGGYGAGFGAGSGSAFNGASAGGFGASGAMADSQAGAFYPANAGMAGSWPFGQNNNPFGNGFPFNG